MEDAKSEATECSSPTGCFLRLFWMMIGNAALLICAFGIVQHRSSMVSMADAFYWAVVGCLLAVRYADIQYFDGLTAEGEPASMVHWRRYATIVGVISVVFWLVTHLLSSFFGP